jgi:hypothetical protein
MALHGIAQGGRHILRDEHIDRRPCAMQPAKDVQGVMLETREWLRREQQIDGDAIGHRTGHSRDASARARMTAGR